MIRTLHRKFVLTAMSAVTLLLLLLLGGIDLAYGLSQSRDSERLLAVLAAQEGMGPAPRWGDEQEDWYWTPPDGQDKLPRGPGLFREPVTEDSRMSALYLVVRLDSEGQVTEVDLRNIASVTEEEAASLAARAVATGKTSGRLGNMRFQIVDTAPDCRSCVLLDVSQQQRAVLRVAALSALAGVLAWGAMLLLVQLLSRLAIRPVAENMARQRQFVTDAGHELKTPLAIIQANVEAMELMGGESKYSRNIRGQVRRLSGLTQNLLTLARLDENAAPPTMEQVSLTELAAEQAESFREPAALRGVLLETELSPGVELRANREQLRQLLSILLDNAVKYCPEGGTIRLTLRQDEKVRLSVANTAPEPRVDLARIFDRFYRADQARTQSGGGYGIGLSAAQAIVRQHKGKLRADYEGEDIVFTVVL